MAADMKSPASAAATSGREPSPTGSRETDAALDAIRRGDLDAAEHLAEGLLKRDPEQAGACHALGLVRQRQGRLPDARDLFARAVSGAPGNTVYLSNLATILAELGQTDAAIARFREVIALRPDYPTAHANLALAYVKAKRHEDAIHAAAQALAIDPTHETARSAMRAALSQPGVATIEQLRQRLREAPEDADALSRLGALLVREGETDEGLALCERACATAPDRLDLHMQAAGALMQVDRRREALGHLQVVIDREPRNTAALILAGNLLRGLDNLEGAEGVYRRVLDIDPDNARALSNLSVLLAELDRPEEAIECGERAVATKPDNAGVLDNLGVAYARAGRFAEAVDCHRRAAELDPRFVNAYNNAAVNSRRLGRPQDGIAFLEKALKIAPEDTTAHWNLANLLLQDGDYRRGFAEYTWRWKRRETIEQLGGRRRYREPWWDGVDIAGKTLFIHHEQGHGDTIQFARYAPLAAERTGARVILGCQSRLKRLLGTLDNVDTVVSRGDPVPRFDTHIALMDLAHVLGTTVDTVPARVPYLRGPEMPTLKLPDDGRPRIGIAWGGNPKNKMDRVRSVELAAFEPLVEVADSTFYSLQIDERRAELETIPFARGIVDLSAHQSDFLDAAGLIAQFDLVITIDTAVAHLSGALARPVWTVLAFNPDWRWMLERTDTPWYPTMRLFRQPASGDWASVFAAVGEALQAWRAAWPGRRDA